MGKGSGSAIISLVLAAGLVCLLIQTEIAEAAVYNVGNGQWTFNVAGSGWTKGKRFRAGDVLVFKYNKAQHNVIKVDAASYNSCKTPKRARVLQTGNDQVKLTRGTNYFICNFPGHCQSGMKIAVNAA